MDREIRRQRLKEARAAQGADFRLHVAPRLAHYMEVQKLAQAWGRLAAACLFLANGAALILPPVLAAAAAPRPAGWTPVFFVLGLLAAVVLMLAAWLTTFLQARVVRGTLGQQIYVGEAINYDAEWPMRYIDAPRGRELTPRIAIIVSLAVSLGAGLASALCLVLGATRLAG